MEHYDITDPREMRKKMGEMAYTGRFNGGPDRLSVCSGIIRNCQQMAEKVGLTGEDLYTFVAWHLLVHAERLEQRALDQAVLQPTRHFLMPVPACQHRNTKAIDPTLWFGKTLRCLDCGFDFSRGPT